VEEHVCALFPEETEDVFEEEDYWHEQVIQTRLAEEIRSDEVANSSPGQLDSEADWKKSRARGSGVYGSSVIWPEQALLELVTGANSVYTVNFFDRVSSLHAPAWARMRGNAARLLDGNVIWATTIDCWLNESAQLAAEVMLQIYSPSDVLSGLEVLARMGDRSHVAELVLGRKYGNRHNIVQGSIVWDGELRDGPLQDTLDLVGLDLVDYLSGGSWIAEATIMRALGLRYVLLESETGIDDVPGEHLYELSLVSGSLDRQPPSELGALEDFLIAHPRFKASLLEAYERTILR
jgi:hypothetical protein